VKIGPAYTGGVKASGRQNTGGVLCQQLGGVGCLADWRLLELLEGIWDWEAEYQGYIYIYIYIYICIYVCIYIYIHIYV